MALSGPQHYQEAEELLKKAKFEENATKKATMLAEAQVHATLAQVAATILPGKNTNQWETFGVRV